jgi:phage shock protein PspC (stress-responsive transcriptional regulator)
VPVADDQTAGPRRLRRAGRGRMIGGVCAGLGRYFGVDPILFRIAFVGTAFFGGLGLWVYLLFLLFVPEEGATRAPIRLVSFGRDGWLRVLGVTAIVVAIGLAVHELVHRAFDSTTGPAFGLGAIAAVGLGSAVLWLRLRRRTEPPPSPDGVLLRCLAFGTAVLAAATLLALASAYAAATGGGELVGWAVIGIGALLLASAFAGGGRWLILPALAVALPATVVAAADVDLHGGVGEKTYRPASLAGLRDSYELGAGRLEVDLRDVPLPPGERRLRVRLGAGELVLLVPEDVCVATTARVGAGYVGALDRETGGLDVDWTNRPSPPRGVPRLLVDADVGIGALEIADRPFGRHGRGFQPGAYGDNGACRRRAGERG